jgi:hypothetical protein
VTWKLGLPVGEDVCLFDLHLAQIGPLLCGHHLEHRAGIAHLQGPSTEAAAALLSGKYELVHARHSTPRRPVGASP